MGYNSIIHPPFPDGSDNLNSIGDSSAVGANLLSGMPLTSNYFRRAHKLQALNQNMNVD